MRVLVLNFLIFAASLVSSCAPPKPDVSSVDSTEQAPKTRDSSATAFDYGGAALGDEMAKANAQSCIESGKFFDRKAKPQPTCTVAQLAKIVCREDALKESMGPVRRAEYDRIKNRLMPGFDVDQCIDCAATASRKTCQETVGRPEIRSGTLVTLVKEIDGDINVRTIFIPR